MTEHKGGSELPRTWNQPQKRETPNAEKCMCTCKHAGLHACPHTNYGSTPGS